MKDDQPKFSENHAHQIVCPWWFCFSFDNPLRKIFQNPERMLKPYIKPGMTILEPGPGMGYFTIQMAKMTGESGKVLAVDLQQKMLEGIYHRAHKARIDSRIKLVKCTKESLGVTEPIDFCLIFWMLHEVPDKNHFLEEIYAVLKKDRLLLLVEPKIHVSQENFTKAVNMTEKMGFQIVEQPKIFFSYSVLIKKSS